MTLPLGQIVHGDALEVLRGWPAESVQAVVTDPPYGLHFMGKTWDRFGGPVGKRLLDTSGPRPNFDAGTYDHRRNGAYQAEMGAIFAEVLRIASPGAHLLCFGGPRTFHRLTCAIEDAGWEIRDVLCWLFGQGFPKSLNLHGEWEGWGTALKPGWEPIILARKPLRGTVAANVQAYGTGALNIDGCRIECGTEHFRGLVKGTQNGVLSAMRGDRDFKASDNPFGRWPPNVAHDGSEEVEAAFVEFGDHAGAVSNSRDARHGMFNSGLQAVHPGYGDSDSASRFFYCAKAGRRDREEGMEGFLVVASQSTGWSGDSMPLRQDGTERKMPRARNNHPTVKPTTLMRWLCRLITPPGGAVLDPFAGSGSTGKAALLEGFRFVGIEREADYCEIARARLAWAADAARLGPDAVEARAAGQEELPLDENAEE